MLDLTTSCRTCMKENATLIDINEKVKIEDNCLQLTELLVQCTTIEVSKEDGLPQNLCDVCVKDLQIAYSFRTQAAKAQEEFKKLLQIKTEPQEFELKAENDHDYLDVYDDFNYNTNYSKNEVEDNDFICSKCNKQFATEKKFLKHLETHSNMPLECTVCKKTYHNTTSFEKHMAKHSNMNIGMLCNENIHDNTLLMKTMIAEASEIEVKTEKLENVIPDQSSQCNVCGMTFTKQRSLSMHMRKHRNNKDLMQFICDTCGKTFTMKHMLKRHLMMHSEVKPYKCGKCSKTYARRDQLLSHAYTHNKNKPYICTYCKKSFAQLCSLKDHVRSHTGETPYLCSQCGKGFKNNSNLRQHMMRHTGLKPYACNMCPKTFCTKGQMTSHMSTHTGEHPYKCEECGAAFTKQNSLKKHSMIHLGVRPFACETCNMRFTCKDHLKRHTRIHTGEKPYKCKYCERAFSQSNDLVKHTRQHIGQNIYQCTICSSRFRLLSELKHHYPVHFVNGNDGNTDLQTMKENPTTLKELLEKDGTIPKDFPILSLKPPEEFNLQSFKNEKDASFKQPVNKEMSLLNLKPASPVFETVSDKSQTNIDSRIVITINSCDTNGVVNGITINLPPKES